MPIAQPNARTAARRSRLCTAFALLAALLLWLALATGALAHGGGTPQLVHQVAGPYAIYASTSPDPLRVGTMHVTVALVLPEDEEPVLNANVQIIAMPPAGAQVTAAATHENAQIKSFYEADLPVDTPGRWRVTVAYQDGDAAGSATFTVEVMPAAIDRRLIGLGAALLGLGVAAVWIGRGRRRGREGA
jgi:hypothetical protein